MKVLFHQLVDPIVKEWNANGGSLMAPAPPPPKIKIKVGGQQGNSSSKSNEAANPNLVQAAVNQANQSLLSAVAAITGEDPDEQEEHEQEQQQEEQKPQPPQQPPAFQFPPDHPASKHPPYVQLLLSMGRPPWEQDPQNPAYRARLAAAAASPPPKEAGAAATPPAPTNPSAAPVHRAPVAAPAPPAKPRPGPPVLSSFIVTPLGREKERLVLRNERGVRAHAITLRETAEIVDVQVNFWDVSKGGAGAGAGVAGDVVAIEGGGMEVDYPTLNGSPRKTPGGAGGGGSERTYSIHLLYNGMPVDPVRSSSSSPSAPPPEMGLLGLEGGEDGVFSRAPPTAFRIVLGSQQGMGRSVGSIEVVVSWRDEEGSGGGRETYEVVVRRG